MNAYIDTFKVTDENGEKSIFYPLTKQEAVEGLEERLVKLEVADITETEDTTLENSNAGRLLFTEIDGAMEQGANPSPTNPQEIRNVLISGIRTHGKNIMTINDVTLTTIKTITLDKPIPAGTYTMSAEIESSDTDSEVCYALFYNDATELTSFNSGRNTRVSNTFTVSKDITIIRLYASNTYNNSLEDTATWSNIQIEKGTEATPYEPYTESVITFSQPIELSDSDKVINTESGFALIIGETEETLPIADQIALNSLQTFDGITYVEFVSEIKPTFSAKYGTTEMGGMTLESLLTARSNDLRLSAVESAVVNNI